MPLKLALRVIIGSLLVFLGVAAVSYMQNRFDNSDEKRAMQAVLAKVPDLSDPSACNAEVISRLKGEVRVRCGNRSWLVNVLGAQIAEEAR